MGVRISNLPSQPALQEDDYLVIDGENGTRKVPATESLVLSGIASPPEDKGVLGSMYIQYNTDQDEVVCIYFKSPTGWLLAPKGGGSYVIPLEVTEGVYSHNTITVVEE